MTTSTFYKRTELEREIQYALEMDYENIKNMQETCDIIDIILQYKLTILSDDVAFLNSISRNITPLTTVPY